LRRVAVDVALSGSDSDCGLVHRCSARLHHSAMCAATCGKTLHQVILTGSLPATLLH